MKRTTWMTNLVLVAGAMLTAGLLASNQNEPPLKRAPIVPRGIAAESRAVSYARNSQRQFVSVLQANESEDNSAIQALEWRCIGPHVGNRGCTVSMHPTKKSVFYHGHSSGGLWQTDDAGQYWVPLTDGQIGVGSIGAMAVSPSKPDVIYIGTGEPQLRDCVSWGDGAYKSIDGGKTWKHIGLKNTRHISRVRVHPTNPDLVYVSVIGWLAANVDLPQSVAQRDVARKFTSAVPVSAIAQKEKKSRFAPSRKQAPALNRSVRVSPNREPAIPRHEQGQSVAQKLAAIRQETGKRPNIVWIIVNDMGYGDPGCYGGGAAIGAATPNIDRLARGGLKLTSCYSQQTCTPTRSAILTGRLPFRTGLTRPILAGDQLTKNPSAGELSIAKLLSDSGYYTALTGKWHVGESKGMRPHDVGFDEYYGYYSAQKEITQRVDPRRYPDLVLDRERLAAFEAIAPDDHLIHGFKGGQTKKVSQVRSTADMGRADRVLADHTIGLIAKLAQHDKPFFLEHCFMKVHCDNFRNPDLGTLSANKYAYKEAVAEVDMHADAIMAALKQAGVLENTFVFFTSDNGPQMDGWPDAGFTPFRGAKGTTFEGGVRIPGIVYWKGMIKPGRESDGIFDLMDLFNTALTLAGISDEKLPKDRYYDGVDQTSFLLHDKGKSNREAVYFWWGSELMACRMRQYKAHVKILMPQAPNMHIDFALLHDVGLAPWLFNLYIDPKEKMPVGHRRNAWLATVLGSMKAHAATFKKYPPKDIGLGR